MPAISEEDEGGINALPTDFSELLQLPDTVFTDSNDILTGSTVAAEPMQLSCPAHPDTTEYVGLLMDVFKFH